MSVRHQLIDLLGGKCTICEVVNKHVLHIDHKYGQGYLEKEWFSSKDEMWYWYYQFRKQEFQYLQVLCMNCNVSKRIENDETKGRPKLEEFQQFYFMVGETDYSFENKNTYFNRKIKEKKDFLDKYPQFIPIDRRLVLYYEKLRDDIGEINHTCHFAKMARWWLPKKYADIIESECKKYGINDKVERLMKTEKIPEDWNK